MNMSYCRFQNTTMDLQDCVDHITDELTTPEHNARKRLISLCQQIIECTDYGDIPDKAKD